MDFERLMKAEYNRQYIESMRPVFNRKALFSDTTENYLSPAEPNPYSQITIRFRAALNNVDRVFMVNRGNRIIMHKESNDEVFDYFACQTEVEEVEYAYHFEVQIGKITCIYDTRGVTKEAAPEYAFRVIPGFKTPAWAKGAVMYQIYVDRFYNGDPTNDVLTSEYEYIGDKTVKVDDWNKYPAVMGVREFYGGDLQGVLDKMDYLQGLGIDVIYFNPLFVSPSITNMIFRIMIVSILTSERLSAMRGNCFAMISMRIGLPADISTESLTRKIWMPAMLCLPRWWKRRTEEE